MTADIYTTREAAKICGIAPPAIRAAIRAGTLKAQKFGNNYAITPTALADYLEYRKATNNGAKRERTHRKEEAAGR